MQIDDLPYHLLQPRRTVAVERLRARRGRMLAVEENLDNSWTSCDDNTPVVAGLPKDFAHGAKSKHSSGLVFDIAGRRRCRGTGIFAFSFLFRIIFR